MTNNLKQFLIEFAELLEKHNAELEAIENSDGYYAFLDELGNKPRFYLGRWKFN